MAAEITTASLLHSSPGDRELAVNGYSIFPLLDAVATDRLSRYYFEFQKEEPSYFYSSTHSGDFGFRKRTSDLIKSVLAPLLPQHLKNYKLLGGAFVVKPPHGKGILQPHQDWNLVDETAFRSYNIWIPLVDVNPNNGAVFVLDGSHNKMPTYRGPGIPSVFKDVESFAWQYMKPLNMKGGEALLYDHALLHGSPANQSDAIRLGIVAGVIPAAADMQLHFAVNDSIDVYECNEDFFLSANPFEGPGPLQKKGTVPAVQNTLGEQAFRNLYLNERTPAETSSPAGFFKRLLSKLKS